MPVPTSTINESPAASPEGARQQDGARALSPVVEEPGSAGYAERVPDGQPSARHSPANNQAPFPPPARGRELHPRGLDGVNTAQAYHADSLRQAARIDRMSQQADNDRLPGARSHDGPRRSDVPIVQHRQHDMDEPER